MKCITFDWGNVCTTSHLIWRFSQDISEHSELSQEEAENAFFERDNDFELGLISSDKFWEYFSRRTGVDKVKARKIFIQAQNADEEVLEYVKSLKQKFLVILLTNNYYDLLEDIRENYSENFHAIYASNELGIKKPDPRIYKRILEDYNLSAEECIFVDDKEKNLKPARELGMVTILFKDLASLKKEINSIIAK